MIEELLVEARLRDWREETSGWRWQWCLQRRSPPVVEPPHPDARRLLARWLAAQRASRRGAEPSRVIPTPAAQVQSERVVPVTPSSGRSAPVRADRRGVAEPPTGPAAIVTAP